MITLIVVNFNRPGEFFFSAIGFGANVLNIPKLKESNFPALLCHHLVLRFGPNGLITSEEWGTKGKFKLW